MISNAAAKGSPSLLQRLAPRKRFGVFSIQAGPCDDRGTMSVIGGRLGTMDSVREAPRPKMIDKNR